MKTVLAVLASVALAGPAAAADLVIGRATEQFSLDPQFAYSGNNTDTADDMFDGLLTSDAANQPLPALAVSWKAVDPLTWSVALRPGVTFHDGAALTAEDVLFSLNRVKAVPNSPAPYSSAMRGVTEVSVTGPLSLQIRTATPMPMVMEQIGVVQILEAKAGQGLSSSDFNAGRGMVGTGPYRFVSASPGERVEMQGFPGYWGGAPAWGHVIVRFIPSAAARVAALLSGGVDVIDQLAPADAKHLEADPKARLFSTASTRLVYLALDSGRAQSPFITDSTGAKLDRNPLQDPRVRRAISKAIDRDAITGRLLDGSGEPAGQMVPEGLGGHDASLPAEKVDVAGAKALLAEAGYPKGFGITVHSSSDRLPQDGAVAQALGQMLRRAGLTVNGVMALPYAMYAPAAGRQEYSAFIFSIGTPASSSATTLSSVLGTYDPTHGIGVLNRARYSNPAFDATLAQALTLFDDAARNAKLAEATRIAMADTALVPLYWQVVHWGGRKGLSYQPRRDEATSARYARPD